LRLEQWIGWSSELTQWFETKEALQGRDRTAQASTRNRIVGTGFDRREKQGFLRRS